MALLTESNRAEEEKQDTSSDYIWEDADHVPFVS